MNHSLSSCLGFRRASGGNTLSSTEELELELELAVAVAVAVAVDSKLP
jgi:hypothetical protein